MVGKDWMFMNLNYVNPDSLQRKEGWSDYNFPSIPTLSTKLESEWLLENIRSNVQVSFFSKDVGILKDPREKWPCAVMWLAPGSTEG